MAVTDLLNNMPLADGVYPSKIGNVSKVSMDAGDMVVLCVTAYKGLKLSGFTKGDISIEHSSQRCGPDGCKDVPEAQFISICEDPKPGSINNVSSYSQVKITANAAIPELVISCTQTEIKDGECYNEDGCCDEPIVIAQPITIEDPIETTSPDVVEAIEECCETTNTNITEGNADIVNAITTQTTAIVTAVNNQTNNQLVRLCDGPNAGSLAVYNGEDNTIVLYPSGDPIDPDDKQCPGSDKEFIRGEPECYETPDGTKYSVQPYFEQSDPQGTAISVIFSGGVIVPSLPADAVPCTVVDADLVQCTKDDGSTSTARLVALDECTLNAIAGQLPIREDKLCHFEDGQPITRVKKRYQIDPATMQEINVNVFEEDGQTPFTVTGFLAPCGQPLCCECYEVPEENKSSEESTTNTKK